MIIVSGEARTGTSVMMLILKRLGFSIAGDKFLRTDHDMNPTGIWEVRGTPMRPLTQELLDLYDITEDVMKVISHGVLQSDLTLIDKLIWMIRDPREIVVSQRRQVNHIDDEYSYNWYNIHMAALVTKMDQDKNWPPTIFINHRELMLHPKRVVKDLSSLLGVRYKANAAKAVNKKYYRSKSEEAERDETAEVYYNYFKQLCV